MFMQREHNTRWHNTAIALTAARRRRAKRAIAVLGACEASAEATGRASAETNSAPHTRKREKLSPRGTKKGSALIVLPNEGI